MDEWLQAIFDAEVEDHDGVALVAVGGYGRAELSPQSDIDVQLLHRDRLDISEIASRLWYPVWDEGLKLGHSVRSPKEAKELTKVDLDTATSLLEARHIAGDEALTQDLIDYTANQWRRRAQQWLPEMATRVADRHAHSGEVAFKVSPELKEGRGGLRDVHALRWAEAAGFPVDDADKRKLRDGYEVLLAARVELHRVTGRPGDTLQLEDQDAVAAALEYADADVLMADVAAAGRSISWISDEYWFRWQQPEPANERRLRRKRTSAAPAEAAIGYGVFAAGGLAVLDPEADLTDPCTALRFARAAATHQLRMDREGLDQLREHMAPMPDPWPDPARGLLVDLLLAGKAALPAIEALDQSDLFVRILPEWEPTRSRPQRNPYHQFTVDRHLCEAAALAAELVERVDRPDLLVIGAWLHDIGKGYPGDHTEVGMELVSDITHRMGFPPTDVDVLVALVEHHLLLPDVATRRDLEDPDTIAEVSRKVRSVDTLRLLGALTEGRFPGHRPLGVEQLEVGAGAGVGGSLRPTWPRGGSIDEITSRFPTPEQRLMMEVGRRIVLGDGDTLTVLAPDRHGMFSRVAGVLALNGLRVLLAAAHSEYGMALERFQVESILGLPIDWPQVTGHVEQALAGRLAIEARLTERINAYGTAINESSPPVVPPKLTVDNELSSTATIVELATKSRVGLLSRVTSALSQLDLDILSAKVQDLGGDVVHAYYLRDAQGEKVTDPDYISEIKRALNHAIDSCTIRG